VYLSTARDVIQAKIARGGLVIAYEYAAERIPQLIAEVASDPNHRAAVDSTWWERGEHDAAAIKRVRAQLRVLADAVEVYMNADAPGEAELRDLDGAERAARTTLYETAADNCYGRRPAEGGPEKCPVCYTTTDEHKGWCAIGQSTEGGPEGEGAATNTLTADRLLAAMEAQAAAKLMYANSAEESEPGRHVEVVRHWEGIRRWLAGWARRVAALDGGQPATEEQSNG
jgi:hypothetical protein